MTAYASPEALQTTLECMAAHLQADEQFCASIAHTSHAMGFELTDLKCAFSLVLEQGQVRVEPGKASNCRFVVRLTSDALDRLFSGQLDPMSAYDSGTLTVLGDEYAAQGSIGRLRPIVGAYCAAKASSDN
jgi:putative sterol carrier protein